MNPTIDYFFAPQSPWTYLGHVRLMQIAQEAGAAIRVLPMDLGGKIFPLTGGLPVGQRPPQRQAWRLLELARFSEHFKLPLVLKPRYFPVAGDDAARLIVAAELEDGEAAAMALTGAILSAVWAQERNIADPHVLAMLLQTCGLPAERLAQSRSPAVQQRYEANTAQAIDAGIFGAPSYVVNGELFWGQDRLDFLERELQTP